MNLTPAPTPTMKSLLTQFENTPPQIVFEWHDPETEAVGWVVINSLRNGAAGGGTRMRVGLDRHEVVSLAKTMEIKFTVSGPAIGGAKSGINFDPHDPRKRGVLERWYQAVFPLLKNYYGTGGDLNVDEIHEVIPITESYGLWHPQEGVVNGHFRSAEPEKIKKLGQLRLGVSKVIEDPAFSPAPERKYTVADMITGYGVAESVRHYYDLWGGQVAGKRVLVQGFGNVAAAAAYYLTGQGAKVVAILDRRGGLLRPEGFGRDQIRELFLNRQGNQLCAPDLLSPEALAERAWQVGAEIFIPAAASRLVTEGQLETLAAHGLEVIACGANVPFRDEAIFFGPVGEMADARVALIPDFVANCGMARAFAYLMQNDIEVTDEAIFRDTSRVIRQALARAHAQNPRAQHLARTCFELALAQLV